METCSLSTLYRAWKRPVVDAICTPLYPVLLLERCKHKPSASAASRRLHLHLADRPCLAAPALALRPRRHIVLVVRLLLEDLHVPRRRHALRRRRLSLRLVLTIDSPAHTPPPPPPPCRRGRSRHTFRPPCAAPRSGQRGAATLLCSRWRCCSREMQAQALRLCRHCRRLVLADRPRVRHRRLHCCAEGAEVDIPSGHHALRPEAASSVLEYA